LVRSLTGSVALTESRGVDMLAGMRLSRRTDLQVLRGSAFAGFWFQPEVIVLAAR
jgi:hypothetical protein